MYAVPSTDISLSFPRIKPMLAGDTLTLECLAVKLNTGFSNMPRITWKRPPLVVLEDEDEVVVNIITSENSFNSSVRSVLTVTPLLTSEAGGYTCLVTLETPLLSHPINYTIERTVTTKSVLPINLHTSKVADAQCCAIFSHICHQIKTTSVVWLLVT